MTVQVSPLMPHPCPFSTLSHTSQGLTFVDCSNQAPCSHASRWVWPIEDIAGDCRGMLGCFRVLYLPSSFPCQASNQQACVLYPETTARPSSPLLQLSIGSSSHSPILLPQARGDRSPLLLAPGASAALVCPLILLTPLFTSLP